jgi:hypothetical protein
MYESVWRREAQPIIKRILANAKASQWSEKELRRALRDAYPFGVRAYHPYKIWLNEIQRQRGLIKTDARGKRCDSARYNREHQLYTQLMHQSSEESSQ